MKPAPDASHLGALLSAWLFPATTSGNVAKIKRYSGVLSILKRLAFVKIVLSICNKLNYITLGQTIRQGHLLTKKCDTGVARGFLDKSTKRQAYLTNHYMVWQEGQSCQLIKNTWHEEGKIISLRVNDVFLFLTIFLQNFYTQPLKYKKLSMKNTNNHHFEYYIFSRQADTNLEQQITTSGLVSCDQRTTNVRPAGGLASLPLAVEETLDNSRDLARQPAAPIGEWPDHHRHQDRHVNEEQGSRPDIESTHIRPATRGLELDIFLCTSSRTGSYSTSAGTQSHASGYTSARGVPQHTENPRISRESQQRPLHGVWQDKGVLTNASSASVQPAPDTKSIRAQFSNNGVVRSQNQNRARRKSGRLTLWGLDPATMHEFERIAAQEGLSLSLLGKTALRQWVHQSLHDQHEAMLYPIMHKLVRDENRALGNRLVFFQMRTAFAAEQTRILTTNLLSRVLKQQGAAPEVFTNLVDQSNKMARRNIIAKTPQLKSLMDQWWADFPQDSTATPGKEEPHG